MGEGGRYEYWSVVVIMFPKCSKLLERSGELRWSGVSIWSGESSCIISNCCCCLIRCCCCCCCCKCCSNWSLICCCCCRLCNWRWWKGDWASRIVVVVVVVESGGDRRVLGERQVVDAVGLLELEVRCLFTR